MFYDNQESRKLDEKVEAIMQQYRSMPEGLLKDTIEKITQMLPVVEALAKQTDRTAEENQLLKNFLQVARSLSDLHLVLEYSLVNRSLQFFEHAREQAAAGEPEAQKVYERLLPTYRQMLRSELDDQVQ